MKKLLFLISLLLSMLSFSQVGIGTTSPNASAQLDVTSTTKGLLPPRMTYAEKAVIPSPAKGLIVFCTDCGTNGELQVYNGTWVKLAVETGSSGKPGAPRNPTATPGNRQATISFDAPESNGGSAITGYLVTIFPDLATLPAESSPFVFPGLSNGSTFSFTVKAVTANGPSPASVPTEPVTPSTVPGIPTNVSATAGNGVANIFFSPPLTFGGASITSYTVTSSPGLLTATGAGIETGNGNELKLVVSGLTTGVSYTFKVVATNVNGPSSSSDQSNEIKAVSGLAICESNAVTEIVDLPSPHTGAIWMDRNLGASRAATSKDDFMAYGCMYQWGRGNDGHASVNWASSSTGTPVNGVTSTRATSDIPGNNLFITSGTDWRDYSSGGTAATTSLWQSTGQVDNNPCPSGYSVPTKAQFDAEIRNSNTNQVHISNTTTAFSQLKLVVAGDCSSSNGTIPVAGTYGVYWTKTINGSQSTFYIFAANSADYSDGTRAFGSSVRCIKN